MLFRQRVKSRLRVGTAAVELALCMPIMVVVVFGTIESCNSIFLKQTATSAAYEAAKICTGTGGTEFAARLRVEEILASTEISGGVLTFDPPTSEDWVRGTLISTTVAIPTSNNLGGINMFYDGHILSGRITMVKQ